VLETGGSAESAVVCLTIKLNVEYRNDVNASTSGPVGAIQPRFFVGSRDGVDMAEPQSALLAGAP